MSNGKCRPAEGAHVYSLPLHRLGGRDSRDHLQSAAYDSDGTSTFRLSVELFGGDEIILAKSEPEQVTFVGGGQLKVKELCIPMKSIPFALPGLYEFTPIANHARLEDRGTALLRILPE